mgnify:CR=1 FL=1
MISLLNEKSSFVGELQKYQTLLEQAKTEQAQMNRRLLESKQMSQFGKNAKKSVRQHTKKSHRKKQSWQKNKAELSDLLEKEQRRKRAAAK